MTSGGGGLEASPANTQPRSAQTSASPVEARNPSEAQRGTTNPKGRQHARGETGALGPARPGCRSMGAGPVHTRTHRGSCVARLGCLPTPHPPPPRLAGLGRGSAPPCPCADFTG